MLLVHLLANLVACFSSFIGNCILKLDFLLKYWISQIRSIEMVHKRFESFPEAFVKNLVSPQTKRWWPSRKSIVMTYFVAYNYNFFYIWSDLFLSYVMDSQHSCVLTNLYKPCALWNPLLILHSCNMSTFMLLQDTYWQPIITGESHLDSVFFGVAFRLARLIEIIRVRELLFLFIAKIINILF